jgi:undecaprenyl-diphosphatase
MLYTQSFLQIILESLPISSSGHLLLMQKILHWPELGRATEYLLHTPTIIILITYFRAVWFPLLMQFTRYYKTIGHMIALTGIADCITALLYLGIQWMAVPFPLWLGFAITAALLFSLYYVPQQRQTLTFTKACILGCVQGVAALPGISRLASTYVAGRWLGLAPHKSFGVSCMLQFPLICAGFLYGSMKQYQGETGSVEFNFTFFVVITSATIISYMLLAWVQRCMERNTLWKFGWYMLMPTTLAFFW